MDVMVSYLDRTTPTGHYGLVERRGFLTVHRLFNTHELLSLLSEVIIQHIDRESGSVDSDS